MVVQLSSIQLRAVALVAVDFLLPLWWWCGQQAVQQQADRMQREVDKNTAGVADLQGWQKEVLYEQKEKDMAAREEKRAAELQRKAAKAGVKATGVPVFDVGGAILPGFDKAKLEALLRQG